MNRTILNLLGLAGLTYIISLLVMDWYWFAQNLMVM